MTKKNKSNNTTQGFLLIEVLLSTALFSILFPILITITNTHINWTINWLNHHQSTLEQTTIIHLLTNDIRFSTAQQITPTQLKLNTLTNQTITYTYKDAALKRNVANPGKRGSTRILTKKLILTSFQAENTAPITITLGTQASTQTIQIHPLNTQ